MKHEGSMTRLGLVCLLLFCATAGAVLAAPPKEDPTLRKEMETSCRKFLDFFAALQTNGSWGNLYHDPFLWAFAAGERHCLRSKRDVDYSKGGETCQKITSLYLPAYEVLGDKRYLDVARKSCDVLVKGQFPNGVLQAHYYVRPDGRVEAARSGHIIEMPFDEGPGPALIMLLWTARLSGEEKYKRAAVRCAELYIRSQNPNGSWPQKHNLETGRAEGQGYAVLNDGATTGPMSILLLVYHATRDPKFLAPIIKAADWLVRVQNKQGGIPGWAEQYGSNDLPCWGRSFEPPAVCTIATSRALGGLTMAYRLTHDETYLAPWRILIKWLREHPREKWGLYTDPKTADPIWAKGRKIYKGGQSDRLRSSAWVKLAAHRVYQPKRLESRMPRVIDPARKRPKPDLEKQKANWRRLFWHYAPGFAKAIAKQNAKGYWHGQSTWKDRAMQCASCVRSGPVPRMLKILHYLAAAEGRVPPYCVATSKVIRRAWLVPDLYDTPLRKKKP